MCLMLLAKRLLMELFSKLLILLSRSLIYEVPFRMLSFKLATNVGSRHWGSSVGLEPFVFLLLFWRTFTILISFVSWFLVSSLSGRRNWSQTVKLYRPHPLVALLISVAPPPKGSTSHIGVPLRITLMPRWLSQTSVSLFPARERHHHMLSARWTRISTAVWWAQQSPYPAEMTTSLDGGKLVDHDGFF